MFYRFIFWGGFQLNFRNHGVMVRALVGGCLLTLAGPVFDSSNILLFYYALSGIRGGRDLFHKNVLFKK